MIAVRAILVWSDQHTSGSLQNLIPGVLRNVQLIGR